jgi:hypothetical protein
VKVFPSRQCSRFAFGFVLLGALVGSVAMFSLACGDCRRSPLRAVAIGAAEPVIVAARIPQGTTRMSWHCWSAANGPRVGRRVASLIWYVPGTNLASSDVVVYKHIGSDESRRQLQTSCSSEACPIAWDGVYDQLCGGEGICSTLVWDIDLEVANPAAIPADGLATEFKLNASFSTLTRSGQPSDAGISDINIDMGCALVTP